MVSSGPMKANPQEEGIGSFPAQWSLVPISEVHGIFGNVKLPSMSRAKARTIAMGCMFRESLGQPSPAPQKKAPHSLTLTSLNLTRLISGITRV